LIDLVLEQDDAQCPFQRALFQGVVVSHRFSFHAPGEVLLYAVVDAHTRPHRAHLVRHVQQVARLEAGYRLHLRGGLHLENTDSVALAEHVVDFSVLEVDTGHIDALAGALLDELDGFLHLR
jgi:hypothetical protein